MSAVHLKFVSIPLLIVFTFLAGSATAQNEGFVRPTQSSLPLDTSTLKPGLAVLYFDQNFVRCKSSHLDDLPQGDSAKERGRPGAPIPYLNHQFGRSKIFDSGTNRLLGMEISGYIRLDRPGTYGFQANSNDGFRLYIDGHLLIDDPAYHSDRLSPEAQLPITEPGWYSLRARYYQCKGTAAIHLYWRPPGAEKFSIVPAKMLAHQQPY
jgi:hypothetical protein